MAIIDDLKQINDDSLRERIRRSGQADQQKKFGLVFGTYLNILLSMTFLSQLAALFCVSGTGHQRPLCRQRHS